LFKHEAIITQIGAQVRTKSIHCFPGKCCLVRCIPAPQEHLGAETTVFGVSNCLTDAAVHAPDDRYQLKQYGMGMGAVREGAAETELQAMHWSA
jgi:hypothetical protein